MYPFHHFHLWFIMPRMKSNGWFNLIFLIVLAAGIYFIVTTVRDAVNQTAQNANSALQPLSQANQAMQTQVAQLMNPTPTIIPDPVTYIYQIQALARLETIQYSVQQVVEVDYQQGTFGYFFGNKILCQVKANIIAGINMQMLQPGDMQFQNDILYVKLPPTEIFTNAVDESKTKIFDIQTGLLADPDPNQALDCIVAAKEVILMAAMEDNILGQAQINAEAFLIRFFAALGFTSTIFVK